jgi:hypothetical protein
VEPAETVFIQREETNAGKGTGNFYSIILIENGKILMLYKNVSPIEQCMV